MFLGKILEHILVVIIFFLYSCDPFLNESLNFLAMAASHPNMSRLSSVNEGKLLKLVENHLLPNSVVLQWQSVKDEDIPTPNTNEIVVLTSFF
jgi:hypothetical protein